MTKIGLFQSLASVGMARTISMLTIVGAILTPGVEAKAQTFIGGSGFGSLNPGDGFVSFPPIPDSEILPPVGNSRNLIPGIASVRIPPTQKIEGTLFDSGDINLYQLQLGFNGKVTVNSGSGGGTIINPPFFPGIFDLAQDFVLEPISIFPNPPITETVIPNGLRLFLFDNEGRGLKTGFGNLSFRGVKDEIFYLGINGTVALNESGQAILDPSRPDFVGEGRLAGWQNPGLVSPALRNYQISFTVTPVPETSSTLSFLALGTLGGFSILKSKFSKKETTKVG